MRYTDNARRRSRRSRSGLGMVELLLAATGGAAVAVALCQCLAASAGMAASADAQAAVRSQAQHALDRVLQDAQGAAYAEASYQAKDGTRYTAGPTTLILRAPSYAADGSVFPDRWDRIVYAATAAGASGPGRLALHRLVETDPVSARPASPDRVIARDVAEARFTCLSRRALPASGLLYTLAAPLLDAGQAAVRSVRRNGAELTLGTGGQVTVNGGQLVFASAPQPGDVLDVLYVIDPLLAGGDTSQAEVSLRVSRDPGRGRPAQESALTSTVTLRNHPSGAGLVPTLLSGLL